MFRRLGLPAALSATVLAAFAVLCAAPATAAPAAGSVCFWTGAGQPGTSWCYTPPGYTDVPESLHDKAASFRSDADTAVYGMALGPGAPATAA